MTDPTPPPDRRLLPADWDALAPMIDRLLDATPDERPRLILELSAGDSARARALTHLVAECEREMPLLGRPAREQFADLAGESRKPILPALIAERYRVGAELGRGGMACVYLGHDLKHGRDVAIKVIRPELSMSLGHDRFLREIEIAARLRHPNIVPLYDSGEVDGLLYFVMPYEDGPSLGAHLSEVGQLPLADAVSVLRDIARALACAHDHGVVHRDVKPDNVMLSGGSAVVTDFGIAKAVSLALTDVAGPTLTQTGSSVGTPAYISPEQATGDPSTDHRADIYSFGCLAYEVFAGHPPFHDQSPYQIIAAHITAVPRPVEELRPDIPASIASLIARCLEKLPEARPQRARDILAVLDGAAPAPTAARPAAAVSRPRRVAGLRASAVPLLAVVLAAAAFYFSRDARAVEPLALAVLPFGNANDDSTMSYAADALAEDVATALARVPGILIKSRSGARAYRGQLGPDVTEAGARLKADYVVTAVMRQDRGAWIVSAELTRALDAASLWTDRFNLAPDEQAGTGERIAASIASAMQDQFPGVVGAAPVLASSQRTVNGEAYRLYLRGRDKLSRRGNSVSESAELFREAIRLDGQFAAAYSGLSMALALFPHFEGVPAATVHDDVVSAARRALELDPSLAQPHIALGITHQFAYQWDSAAGEFETAIRLDSHSVEARVQYARHLLFRKRNPEAMEQLLAARSDDPASALLLGWISYAYYLDGAMDSALVESRRALDNDPESQTSICFGVSIRIANGLNAEARELLARCPPHLNGSIALFMSQLGDTAGARRRLAEEDAESPQPWMAETRRALSHLAVGDTAGALAALERATDAGETWSSGWPVYDPHYAPLWGSARFEAILHRVGLDDLGPLTR